MDGLGTILSAIGLAASAAAWFAERYVHLRRRMTYRVHLDSPIGITPKPASTVVELVLHRDGSIVPQASMALIRIRNVGRVDVKDTDIDIASPLTLTFGGRTVVGVEIPEAKPPELERMIRSSPEAANMTGGPSLVLPRISLNRRDGFKLLVLLSGSGQEIAGSGYIRGGVFRRDTNRTSAPSRVLGAVTLVLAGLLVGLFTVPDKPAAASIACGRAPLVVEGSTAFASAVTELVNEYHNLCPDSKVEVEASGSLDGLQALRRDKDPGGRIAMSDGLAPAGMDELIAHPAGILVFTMVAHRDLNIHNLTVNDVRGIYSGAIRNWRDLGGPDLEIKIISRGAESGTRKVFQEHVLGGGVEGLLSSYDCQTRIDGVEGPVRCERDSTEEQLLEVAETPGAIGYAQLSAAAKAAADTPVNQVKLDGSDGNVAAIAAGKYPFWAVEYFYTYGSTPAPGTAADAFLRFTDTGQAKNILRSAAYIPCRDQDVDYTTTLCSQR